MLNRFTSRTAARLAGVALLALLGCGDPSGLGKRYPVSGTVSYNGKPVEKGQINFIPEAPDGHAANGEITNGRFSLTTASPNDGALPGRYKVTVVASERDTTELKAIAKGGEFHHDEAYFKAMKNAKPLVPSKYQLADTSGLTYEVKSGTNAPKFDLSD